MVKNCDLGLENASISISRPRSQFFTIRTSQPANNIYVFDSVVSFFLFLFGFFLGFFCRLWREVLLCQNPLFIDN